MFGLLFSPCWSCLHPTQPPLDLTRCLVVLSSFALFALVFISLVLSWQVDSVLSSREKYDDTTHGTLTSVKTTLMQEWDGLRTGGDRVVVIASTNRPFDLDEAVLRRLPRRILVDLPDAEVWVGWCFFPWLCFLVVYFAG